jgi:hypothetical protein
MTMMENSANTLWAASVPSTEFSDLEEAARYALLQRIAPALQHHLMGKFQSMGMIAAMMELRFRSAAPDLASLQEDCSSLGNVSRTAASSILDIMTWVEPKAGATVKFDAGVGECVGLLATKLRFKGFAIVNEVSGIEVELSSRTLRSVLGSALIALTDLSKVPVDLVIRAHAMREGIALTIDLKASERINRNTSLNNYRPLRWRDVEILAIAESVQLFREETRVQMTFPHARVNPDFPAGALVRSTG